MTARKYQRANNANAKIKEEIDLIQIIKTLRRSRFLTNHFMDSHQQQLIDYHKEYSLETKTIKDKHFKMYTKKELISYITR